MKKFDYCSIWIVDEGGHKGLTKKEILKQNK